MRTIRRKAPLLTRMARAAFEARLLRSLSEAQPAGLAFGDLQRSFKDVPLTQVLDGLVQSGEVRRFDGCLFTITEAGLARLAPPACLAGGV